MLDYRKNLGMLLLAVFMILHGLFVLAPSFTFTNSNYLMGILALAAGILLLLGR